MCISVCVYIYVALRIIWHILNILNLRIVPSEIYDFDFSVIKNHAKYGTVTVPPFYNNYVRDFQLKEYIETYVLPGSIMQGISF